MAPHALVAVLEADFRELGQLARKGDGGFGGFFASENTELREAADRAVLKVRSFADFPNAQDSIRETKVGAGCRGRCRWAAAVWRSH